MLKMFYSLWEKMFIISKNRWICFLLLWIVSIRCVTTSCDTQIPHGEMTWWCRMVGQPCPYSCHEGYKDHDTVSWLKCSTSGHWVPWFPDRLYSANFTVEDLCTPKTCTTVISKGTLSAGCQAVVGSICNFSCVVGYVRNASVSELTCQPSTEWSPDVRSLCLRPDGQQCPYAVAGGHLNLGCIREPGHTCSFACNEGYQPSLSPSIIACGSNLEWNYDLGSLCKEIICPSLFEGGYVASNCIRGYQAMCFEYQCNPGYAKSDPASYVTCDESGKWVSHDRKSQPCVNDTLYSFKTTSTVPRNEISIVGIAIGCVMGTILVTVSVGLVILCIRASHKRIIFGHENNRCMGPTGYPQQNASSTAQNQNTTNTGVAAPNVHSFDSRIDMISNKHSGLPPSYSQIQVTSKEYPPAYEQVVANPSVFNL
ncbi:hypothetical protein ACJMK2_017296 [Sinanodonta woodiana]|uniref:Sushi domain-containing protein n=1 Tax=Sinanodonta woodiana TaxID=1069815 RepID=A0ABD3UZM3_SINWO